MDTLSHGLWGGVVFGRRHFWWAFLFGMGPDLLSFGPFFVMRALAGFPAYPMEPGMRAPALSFLPAFVPFLYNITHSLIIWLLLFSMIWIVRKKPFWIFGAWALHILLDIPTHTTRYFPTPFLWPFPTPFVDGIPWSRPWFFYTNLSALLIGVIYHWWKTRPGRKLL